MMLAETLPHWGADHLVALAGTALAATLLSFWFRHAWRRELRAAIRRTCLTLTAVLIGNDLLHMTWNLAVSMFDLHQDLPLHLCDLGVYATGLALLGVARGMRGRAAAPVAAASPAPQPPLSPSAQQCYELSYFWSLAGTTQALLTPEISDPFPSRAYVQFFIMHGGTVAVILALTIGLGLRPTRGAAWRAWLITAGVAVFVGLLNIPLGANYMYLCGPPLRVSLYDYLGRWPWSLVSLGLVGAVLFTALDLPFWHGRRRRA